MRSTAIDRRRSDSFLHFALAWTAAVAFLRFVAADPPDPALLLTLLIVALPYATSPRHRIAARAGAAALLAGFVIVRGATLGGFLFAPAVAALLYSAYRARSAREEARRGLRARA